MSECELPVWGQETKSGRLSKGSSNEVCIVMYNVLEIEVLPELWALIINMSSSESVKGPIHHCPTVSPSCQSAPQK